jgi:hypothetical protein
MQNELRLAEEVRGQSQGTNILRPMTDIHFNIRGIPFFFMITISS